MKDHQDYSTLYDVALEWVNGLKEKVRACADVAGDKHTAQDRLEKLKVCHESFPHHQMKFAFFLLSLVHGNNFCTVLQDLEKTKEEGEPRVAEVVSASEIVLPNTGAPGKEIIAEDIEALEFRWTAFLEELTQV